MQDIDEEIAGTAARLIVDEGLAYGPAKRRAVQQLGLPSRTRLPDNDRVEDAVREHLAIFCADTQPGELRALRELALMWMQRMSAHSPHLGGAVWHGTATRLSDVYIQLFCEDPKSAELDLINRGVRYQGGTTTGFRGEPVDALSLSVLCPGLNEHVGVHLLIYSVDDLRGALKPDTQGRKPRGSGVDLERLLAEVA